MVEEVFLDQDTEEAGQAPGVGAWLDLEVDVGEVGGFGADRVDDDHRAGGVLGDVLEHGAGPRDAVGLPGVLAEEEGDFGAGEVAGGVAAGEVGVDESLTGLLLGKGVGAVAGAQSAQQGTAVGTAEVVSLSAAPVEEDRLAAVGVAQVLQPRGDLA
ncbi:hypothetical protein RI060_01380 [Streptomyces janthinus]|uniref:Uncharacterized protein n=1 Tax=Streptomyces violaceus TaxID=1936 RepID=A0ABY9U140_STRVL|nr:hypothetical protein [Streptomyces janthinus]WND16085.1 hypothetical protein RI060_01380 [Streptomyces janthinus]GGS91292.1 hypothetical protein GCM10010270_74370 [Streptomyces janthinus]